MKSVRTSCTSYVLTSILSVTEAIERYIFSDFIKRDTIRSYIAMIILVRIFLIKISFFTYSVCACTCFRMRCLTVFCEFLAKCPSSPIRFSSKIIMCQTLRVGSMQSRIENLVKLRKVYRFIENRKKLVVIGGKGF